MARAATDLPRIMALALLVSRGKVLILQRPEESPLARQWEFPGGKVEFGEHPWDALRRELREELGLRINRGALFGVYSHVYDVEGLREHFVLVAYLARIARSRIREGPELRWASPRELRSLPVVPGSRPIVADLARRGPKGFI